jgi:hypothetical protein
MIELLGLAASKRERGKIDGLLQVYLVCISRCLVIKRQQYLIYRR